VLTDRGGAAVPAPDAPAPERDRTFDAGAAAVDGGSASIRSTKPLVVIDPGHGGEDTGKIGPNGLHEKHLTLALSRRLADEFARRAIESRLTRTAETLIALVDRPGLANRWRAGRPAVFLSIHANSFVSSSVKGFETFFLSDARTEDERRVAEMENDASRFDDRPVLTSEVDHILNDMRNDFYVRASGELAEVVQGALASVNTGPNRGVKRAGFKVLVGALMPAVLVEVAFISNPDEARMLSTPEFQDSLARAIADVVQRFFERNAHLWTAGGPPDPPR
jgi:N-acetylmuramoyl-L-alanine amidase